jgi:ArsR family transcriptional regulator, virulence genes transcriptional regulator
MKHAPLSELCRHAEEVARYLRVLAHPDRLIMLCRMIESEVAVGELVALTGQSQSSVSQHLATLRESGAVEVRAEAQSRFYSVADPKVKTIIGALCAACGPQSETV